MSATYTQNPPTVTAEQFQTAVTPWPDGVDQCELLPDVVHCHAGAGALVPVAEGDWIVTEARGARTVLADALFRAAYTLVG